jgi:hypothetical protein
MKSNFLLLIVLLVFLFSTAIALAEFIPDANKSGIELSEGENLVLIPEHVSPFYVSDLMKSYPEILTITYFEFEREIGYANIFGGVGEDFIIYPNKEYNFTVEKNVEVRLR